jgi:imidazolonepropionase-like amidohydrolase
LTRCLVRATKGVNVPTTVLRGGAIYLDGATVDADIRFDERVLEIGAGLNGERNIDITGCVVLPGLIDAHVHLLAGRGARLRDLNTPLSLRLFEALENLRSALAGGAVYVRDGSGADAGMRMAVANHVVTGPRMKVAIRIMHTVGGHGDGYLASGQTVRPFPPYPGSPDTVFDGPADARRVARALLRDGADVLKVAVTGGTLTGLRADAERVKIRPDELAEIVAEARLAGVPVMAHAHGAAGAAFAARAGVTSVAHGTFLDDEAAQVLARCGTVLVPTLSASWALRERDPSAYGPIYERHVKAVQSALAAGVSIVVGTDAGIAPHGLVLSEVDHLVAAGMPVHEAIDAAAARAAALLAGVFGLA